MSEWSKKRVPNWEKFTWTPPQVRTTTREVGKDFGLCPWVDWLTDWLSLSLIYVTWFQGYTLRRASNPWHIIPKGFPLLCVSCQPPKTEDAGEKQGDCTVCDRNMHKKKDAMHMQLPQVFPPLDESRLHFSQSSVQCTVSTTAPFLSCNTVSFTPFTRRISVSVTDWCLHMPTVCLSCWKKNTTSWCKCIQGPAAVSRWFCKRHPWKF